jgi:proton-translocating NADH-quinone oxidoreductase chain L
MDLDRLLPILLSVAWLLPLASFALILFAGPRMGKGGRLSAYVATGAIGAAMVLSLAALGAWLFAHPPAAGEHGAGHTIQPIAGEFYSWGQFGSLRITLSYYIDALTVAMFAMVTLVATCIHVYSFGYMHEELHEVTDPLATTSDGRPLKRRGRFPRFFQYMSLFCFSMLGLVIAGNVAMVFMFWELVGICSYLLIGFYFERRSASNAANKAFIVNRVGDFGMIVGLMAIWGGLGTFAFGDSRNSQGQVTERGIFSQVQQIKATYSEAPDPAAAEAKIAGQFPRWHAQGLGYWLLVVAGLGIFCGCVGKSAQFPLHVWLPDAMEGPTPVSALIHAATMVAAGVYLVGRFFSVFTPEVLLVIAVVGCITLFIAATIALTATDIKRVLAYSTVSQLGYMMLALGVGGWVAGLFHLFTHAFFKALLFLCSGSVIHACGTAEMPQMGGLWKKMPWTAWTTLVGCLAISGAGVPLVIGLSGYYSKDAILAQLLSFKGATSAWGWLYYVAVLGAAMTAFYMFRLWFLTFAGKPRDQHVYGRAHESPKVMVIPLVVLAVFAVIAGWDLVGTKLGIVGLLEQARPAGTAEGASGGTLLASLRIPAEHESHALHVPVSFTAFGVALAGFLLAGAMYWRRWFDPARIARSLSPVYRFLRNKWWFDEAYQFLFVRPALRIAQGAAAVDRNVIDWLADNLARSVQLVSVFDDWIDRTFVDGLVNGIAAWTYWAGLGLRTVQTGRLRQYVMLVAVGTVALFVIVSFLRMYAFAAP